MDYLEKYGIPRFINAHDTITLYGGSRMSKEVFEAMEQMSSCFTDILLLQKILGERIAKLTHNEAAYIAGSASGALLLCGAAAMCGDDAYRYRRLPDTEGIKDQILVLHGQYHCYVKALEGAGAKIGLVGDADEVLPGDLWHSIDEKTAAILYTTAQPFQKASLSLRETIEIAHKKDVPVIVDAAAQLPPASNLWIFTEMGADMVIFSGGKSLMGPQASGLIVGKREWIRRCISYGSPNHGICRSAKISREAMIGLCVAMESYMEWDHEKERERWSDMVDQMAGALKGEMYHPVRIESGSVGQTYPRLVLELGKGAMAEDVRERMYQRHIFVGCDKKENRIYISPQNLTEVEWKQVVGAFKEIEEGM